jgi:hypothetical protein
MADANKYFLIRHFPLTTTEWTPIVVPTPCNCSQVVLENGDAANSQLIRTDPADANTQKTLQASLELRVTGLATCFNGGDILCYAQASAGVGPIIASFIR